MLRQFLCSLTALLLAMSIGFAQVVHIPDANLQQAIQEDLGVTPPFTQEDMMQLTRLHAIEKGIVNIQGLEFAVHLTELDLAGNPIKDISPLQGLTQLTYLGLGSTNVSDLSPLSTLITIIALDLGGNQISDLSPLSTLTGLRKLDLQGNQISNLSPLADLVSLKDINLRNNPLSDLRPLSNLTNLEELEIAYCQVSDVSPLAGLVNLRVLIMHHNPARDFTPLSGLKNLKDFDNGGICEIAPLPPPVTERIANRTYPSIALPQHSLLNLNTEPIRFLTWWDDPDIYYDVATQHDMYHYASRFGLSWHLTLTESTEGLSTRLVGHPEFVMKEYQKYGERNPNMLFIPEIRLHNHTGLDAFPPDSDFWLRDADGHIIKNDVPWDEWTMDILNPEVQQLLIDRVVGIAECGYFNGVLFDAFDRYHQYFYAKHFNIGDEEVIQAYISILKGIRASVRDDFLILVNRNWHKSPRYAEWINGSLMETAGDYPGGYTQKRLMEIEDALLWNEKHLREPRINILLGEGVIDQLVDGPENLRWMRVFTTLSLTHSDGYCIFGAPLLGEYEEVPDGGHIWYDFWNADLGRPVGGAETKGQLYENREGLFIREFTNGWAVYNRSGRTQDIQLPEQVNGWASGVENKRSHTLSDLDGEIYLKVTTEVSNPTDVNKDSVVNILDLVLVAQHLNETVPPNSEVDINEDGIVNILDLILVAQHLDEQNTAAAPAIISDTTDAAVIQAWIERAQVEDNGSITFRQGIANLQSLLASLIPEKTALLPNYPNPFNPETWIPYQLSEPAEVTLRIYSVNGTLIRSLALGYLPAGIYENRSRAVYWDGKNDVGEAVASGIYFYQLQADNMSLLRKMLILK